MAHIEHIYMKNFYTDERWHELTSFLHSNGRILRAQLWGLQETSWTIPTEIAKKVAAPRLTPENAAILARIKANTGTAYLRADLQGELQITIA